MRVTSIPCRLVFPVKASRGWPEDVHPKNNSHMLSPPPVWFFATETNREMWALASRDPIYPVLPFWVGRESLETLKAQVAFKVHIILVKLQSLADVDC